MGTIRECPLCGKIHLVTMQCDATAQQEHLKKSFTNPMMMAAATDLETSNIAKYNLWRDGHK